MQEDSQIFGCPELSKAIDGNTPKQLGLRHKLALTSVLICQSSSRSMLRTMSWPLGSRMRSVSGNSGIRRQKEGPFARRKRLSAQVEQKRVEQRLEPRAGGIALVLRPEHGGQVIARHIEHQFARVPHSPSCSLPAVRMKA